MTSYNKRHKKQILQEASILLEYNRIKNRTKPHDKVLWETIENLYEGTLLTEERLTEQKAIFNWIKKLGKNALGAINKFTSTLTSGEQKIAQDLSKELGGTQQGSQIKSLLKKGNWGEALQKGLDTVNKHFSSGQPEDGEFPGPKDGGIGRFLRSKPEGGGQLAEGFQETGDAWRKMKVWKKVTLVLGMIAIMFVQASPGEKTDQDQNLGNQTSIEYSMDGEKTSDLNAYDKGFDNNTQKPNTLNFGDKTIQNAGYETGVSFELGSSNLDTQGQQQIDDIANDYLDKIAAAQNNGDVVHSLDIDVQGGASNTGEGWDKDNKYDGSLTQNRESEASNALNKSLDKLAAARGMDISGVDINYNVSGGMDQGDLGGDENVKTGQKTSTQNTLLNGVLTHEAPAQEAPTDGGIDIDINQPVVAKFNLGGEKTKITEPPTPGVAKGSRNLELRDLLFLGGIDPIPVTFGDYKSDSDMGRVDWRDVDIQGNKFLEDQQKMAVWITNTRKSKFPILKRTKNALQGIIDIEFDGAKYLGNVGPKYDPSTTTPITQKRNMGPRGPNKFVDDPVKGGYMPNPALAEAKGELPPEFIKQPEIPPKIKSLQGNTTGLWKYILGNKALGNIITSQVAAEFDKNIKSFLEQLDLMYGKSGTRGNVNFRYRRNPNYEGTKYSDIPTTWNKKVSGEPETPVVTVPGQSGEALPYVQDYTGDYIQGSDGPLVGSEDFEELQEQIKRIKQLLL